VDTDKQEGRVSWCDDNPGSVVNVKDSSLLVHEPLLGLMFIRVEFCVKFSSWTLLQQ